MKHALVGSRQYLLIAMASTIVFGLLILLVLADQRHDMALCDQLVEGQCQQLVNECSLRLQSEITERVNDLAILAVHLSMHGDKDEREQHFVRVASTVVADQPAYHVLNYVDSDSIVRVSVPVGKRPELLGLDLKTLPGRTDLHRRVMESGEPLASPVMTLTTGDPGLVIWYPIRNGLEDRNASGMVAGTFHLNTMLARCIPVNAEDHFQILLSQDGNQFHPSPPQISAKADSFQTQETCAQFILVGCYWKVTAEPLPVSPLARLPQRIKERGAVGFVAASLFALLFGTTLTAFARARRSRAVALESEQRYRSLVDTMNEGLAIVDGSGVYTYVNQLFCEILGRERDEVIGHCPVEFAAEESKTAAEHQIVARRQGNEDRFQIAVRRKSGELRHIIVSPRLIRDSDGRFAGWLSVITDITEIKQTEQDREHLIRDLEAKNAELERFTYTVSHDLKSPLITIKGFLGLVEAEALEGRFEEMKQDIARVDSAAGKMQDLLDQLLKLSRIGRFMGELKPVSVTELAQEAAALVRGRALNSGVHVEISPDLPAVTGDRSRLLELFVNLIDNAVKFSIEGCKPYVEVGCRLEDVETVFYVMDKGIGIDPRFHDKVFELFDKLNPETEGTGVGLSLVKRIVEMHRGRIWIESLQPGTRFCFTLPVAKSDDARPEC